jgi:transcriptional regulator with XRE-family HTH domain
MFGEFIKTRRIGKGLTLRKFCILIETDPSNWSKVERGMLPAPQEDEKLKTIANVLGIFEGSDDWQELQDKAMISAGAIPKDFLTDDEALKSLPMFFRTIRSEKPTPEELDMLIEVIRRGK